jgi:hypothetical protein
VDGTAKFFVVLQRKVTKAKFATEELPASGGRMSELGGY